MEKIKNRKRIIEIAALALCNVSLIVFAVFFAVRYTINVQTQKSETLLENFCNTVDTMRQISERYLDTEVSGAESWAAYIRQTHMTMNEALAYIGTLDDDSGCEAHIVDMETFEARSTRYTDGDNSIEIYRRGFLSDDAHDNFNVGRMRKLYDGEKCVLSKYDLKESQQKVIAVGTRVTLREADGGDRDYLLLRVIPVERMKKLWLFPTSFSAAQIGLIATNGDYVIPSAAMRSENFVEFVRYYNFQDDYYGADRLLAQLTDEESGLLTLKDVRGQSCYWYYSALDGFDDLDILGYIPVSALATDVEGLSIVLVVAVTMLLLILLDGGYILSINSRLRKAAKAANAANRSKTQFLSTMSHDIRTPLNAVLGMTELAENRIDDRAYVQECLGKIMISGTHLLTLINDILEISRVESGRINLTPAPLDIRRLTESLESLIRSQATGHGLTFTVEIGDLPYATLMGDKLRLTQVYLNLLNNAVKYTNPGGSVRFSVYEETTDEADKVMLVGVVRDTGMGMTAEFQEKMYDAFARVADSRIDKIQGTGLGLAIVKRMVDLMEGSIECDSTVGVGTTFTVRIPLTAAVEAEDAAAGAVNADGRNDDLRGLHVLVAEDNDLNWEIISTMLSGYGIRCDRAENGRECVDMLTAAAPGTYALVLMDVQMPVMNGLDAARALRTSMREDLRQIPIAAMTADAFAEDVQSCMEAGMNAHVAKPIEIDKVLSAIRLLLSGAENGKTNNQ